MPGRDELIQQNLNRAQGNINSTTGSGIGGAFSNFLNGVTQPVTTKSIFGANYDVAAALNSINFIPYSFGEMRGSVAYIRRWKKNGLGAVTRVESNNGPFGGLGDDLNRTINSLIPGVTPGNIFPTSPPQGATIQPYSLVTPVNPSGAATSVTPQPGQTTSQASNSPSTTSSVFGGVTQGATSLAQGLLYSANPGGSLAGWVGPALKKFGGPTIYSGKGILGFNNSISAFTSLGGTVGRIPQTSVLQEGIWQFLFNPSEIEISAGPEFNTAEAWGVSEKENSGRPLQWSRNKNAELKFNDILLNGYVFGKQVDDLEQGIFDLFMSREGGAGQHGPDILEFVWGRRTFGPCVIKDIIVKEKMWDNGLVVNATVSFVLEQIPEWTINDGFVDIARPGREPLRSTPIPQANSTAQAQAQAQASTQTPTDTSQNPNPQAQAQPQQQRPQASQFTPEQIVQKCNGLRQNYNDLRGISGSPNVFGIPSTSPIQAQNREREFGRIYNEVLNNRFGAISAGGFTPSAINSRISAEWNKAHTARARNIPTSQRTTITYPADPANDLISRGVGYLQGGMRNQIISNCPNTARELGLSGGL